MRRVYPCLLPCLLLLALVLPAPASAEKSAEKSPKKDAAKSEKAEPQDLLTASTFQGLSWRGIGPALTSGRISDLAVDPADPNHYYVAVASGGVWETTNAGTTWTPIFDDQRSYSIGVVTLDPNDPLTVWVGTGENNSQRSVGYGDGVYRSRDGGKSWEHVGLAESEHVGAIVVDPRDSRTVYVAAQGPLWRSGGDRGLYKSTDGGESWQRVLEISPETGVNEVVYDPRNPDVLYASAYQRRRHVWTLINGGPESAIYKSLDAGASWEKLTNGLPEEEMGRIGLAVSPADPDVVYAIVEAANAAGGFFRSRDRGATWEKRSDYVSGSPQYYNEIVADPRDVDRVYAMDTWMMVTEDGGATFAQVGGATKHVDDHALWIDPANTDHLRAGCDGGLYESFDRGATWRFFANLPVTQFYKVAVDDDTPFYNVYGGTQDNFTLGGPSRTVAQNGITNREWVVVVGGDGFAPQVDPENPDVVYAQSQYGHLVRYDRRSGEVIDIQPQPGKDEAPLRFNWDSPLIVSPHSPTRLYFAAQRLFRSDDRGDGWQAVSGDLTRQLDRNRLPVMGKVWSVDAVAKNASTSFYGNVVSIAESPLVEGLLYAGTDDGLVQVREPDADSWRRIETFPGVPERTYVNDLEASLHDPDTVFAAFNNHKNGDFAPYALKSVDRGRSWTSIHGDLPARGSVYALAQDHVDPDLLFAGTEFGAFFTRDGGRRWIQLDGGMPVIAVRDLAIQRRENDLVAATFGRGFYVLDDYTLLRRFDPATLERDAVLFPVKDAAMYMRSYPLGLRDKAFQGDGFYTAPNPPFGAVFTYYLKDALATRSEQRRKAEKEAAEAGTPLDYPSWDALRNEAREPAPAVVLTVRDDAGAVVRRLAGPIEAGFHRVAWDLRYPPAEPVTLEPLDLSDPFVDLPIGPMAVPGRYTVTLERVVDGVATPLGEPQSFAAEPLGLAATPAADRAELLAFQQKTARLQRAVLGAASAVAETQLRLDHLAAAVRDTPAAAPELADRVRDLALRLDDVRTDLEGDALLAARNEPTPPSILDRVQLVVGGHWTSTSAPTRTHRAAYDVAAERFADVLAQLRQLITVDLAQLESDFEAAGAPWTPGRIPSWQPE